MKEEEKKRIQMEKLAKAAEEAALNSYVLVRECIHSVDILFIHLLVYILFIFIEPSSAVLDFSVGWK